MKNGHQLLNVTRIERLGHQFPRWTQFGDLFEEVDALGPEHHVVAHVVPLNGGDQIFGPGVLGIHVDANLAALGEFEGLIEGWDPEVGELSRKARPQIQLADFREGHIRDAAFAVGHAIHSRIVHEHEVAV